MDGLLLHPKTQEAIEGVKHRTVHALLLTGDPGAGKHTLAELIAAQMLGKLPSKTKNHPFILRITPNDDTIGIEEIRELKKFVSLKTFGSGTIRRIIIIETADLMTHQAQNSLLKTLEEPPSDTQFIISTSFPEELLPTVSSRTTTLNITPPAETDIHKFFIARGYSSESIKSAFALSSGALGLMTALLQENMEHPVYIDISTAKSILTQSKYDRLAQIDVIAKQRPDVLRLLVALKRICKSALHGSFEKGDIPTAEAWRSRLLHISQAESVARSNANLKLILSDLFLAL